MARNGRSARRPHRAGQTAPTARDDGADGVRYRHLPWWWAAAYLPVPPLSQWIDDQARPGNNGDVAALASVLLLVPVLVAFTVRTWRMAGGTRGRRVLRTIGHSVAWSLALCFLLLVPMLATRVVAGQGSRYLTTALAPPLALLLWPALLCLLAFVAVCCGGIVMLLRGAFSAADRTADAGDGTGPEQTAWSLRGVRLAYLGGVAMLLGGLLLVAARVVDSLGDGVITVRGRAIFAAIVQGWAAPGPTGWLIRIGAVLFVGGIAAVLAYRAVASAHRR